MCTDGKRISRSTLQKTRPIFTKMRTLTGASLRREKSKPKVSIFTEDHQTSLLEQALIPEAMACLAARDGGIGLCIMRELGAFQWKLLRWKVQVVVVSAMGSHPSSPIKVTDLLLKMVDRASRRDQSFLLDLAAIQVSFCGLLAR